MRSFVRRAIAALLYLYPAGFRRAYGADMLATFDEGWAEQPSWRLAARTILDLASASLKVQFTRRGTDGNGAQAKPRGDGAMSGLWQDLRFAVRTLRRSPGFTIVALATLALGIGVNTAMFSVAHAVLWRAMPYPHPERVVMVGEVDKSKPDMYWGASYANFKDWQARAKSFEAMAGVEPEERVLREGTEPVRIPVTFASHEFFEVLGVAPEMGRPYGPADDRRGADPVIVLSHRMWTTRFGSDPKILGRSVRFDMGTFNVIGVMPAGFGYDETECWMPLAQVIAPWFVAHRNVWVLHAIGRLRAGATEAQAQAEVEGIAQQIRDNFPETRRGLTVRVDAMQAELTRDLRPALLVLMGAVGFVLLIACGNLAGLMLVRGTSRAREMAIRSVLGVGWARLMRQLLTVSAVLAIAGGALGIGLAFWATRFIGALTKDPRLLGVSLNAPVMAFAACATLATTILFGIAPALRATRVDANEALKSGSRAGTAPERALAQRALVTAEVALCLVLLAGAGLLLKSFRRVMDVDPGFRTEKSGDDALAIAAGLRHRREIARILRAGGRATGRRAGSEGRDDRIATADYGQRIKRRHQYRGKAIGGRRTGRLNISKCFAELFRVDGDSAEGGTRIRRA